MDEPENNLPATNLQSLWQDQPTEPTLMSLEAVQQRAAKFQSRIRFNNWLVLAIVTIATPLYATAIIMTADRLMATGYLLTLLGMLFAFHYLSRRSQSDTRAVSLVSQACVDFHKRTLIRWRDLARTSWAWGLLPVIPGAMLMFYCAHRMVSRASPHIDMGFGIAPATFLHVCDGIAIIALTGQIIYSRWSANRFDRELKTLGGEN